MLRKLNPFAGLPNPRVVWAWGMFDLANQSFTLLIITMFFSIYVQKVVADTPQAGDRLWSLMFSTSMLVVVLVSPIIGALADARAWKKEMLVGTGLVCVALTCAFGLIGPGDVALAAALFIPANIAYCLGENFLASFLPEIATTRNMGRISATGWAMGYLGALLLLIISGVAIKLFGWEAEADWPPLFVFAGIWFLAAMIPPFLFLHEKARPRRRDGALAVAFQQLAVTVRSARQFRQLIVFLAIFFVYSLGSYSVVAFAGIVTTDTFKFDTPRLVLFILQLTITAGAAAIVTGRVQDRLGHRRTVMVFLAIWVFSTVGLALMSLAATPPEYLFWILANGVGFGLGGIGTSSRALVGCLTPAHKTAEFFGLWGTAYKLAGVAGPFAFGFVKAGIGDSWALFLLSAFFGAGFVLMFLVDEQAGMEAARRAELEAGPAAVEPSDVAAAAALGERPEDVAAGGQSAPPGP